MFCRVVRGSFSHVNHDVGSGQEKGKKKTGKKKTSVEVTTAQLCQPYALNAPIMADAKVE